MIDVRPGDVLVIENEVWCYGNHPADQELVHHKALVIACPSSPAWWRLNVSTEAACLVYVSFLQKLAWLCFNDACWKKDVKVLRGLRHG
jgi:hypothetical protein